MIRALCISDGPLKVIRLEGHAKPETHNPNLDELDYQRVCAAVSAFCVTLTDIQPTAGHLLEEGRFVWKGDPSSETFAFFKRGLELLAHAYPAYITITGF